jgi:ABC-type phosphate transport system auxiliary subunit
VGVNTYIEKQKQKLATHQTRVIELETILEGMNTETEKQKLTLANMEHTNAEKTLPLQKISAHFLWISMLHKTKMKKNSLHKYGK